MFEMKKKTKILNHVLIFRNLIFFLSDSYMEEKEKKNVNYTSKNVLASINTGLFCYCCCCCCVKSMRVFLSVMIILRFSFLSLHILFSFFFTSPVYLNGTSSARINCRHNFYSYVSLVYFPLSSLLWHTV